MDNCKEKIDLGHYWDLKKGYGVMFYMRLPVASFKIFITQRDRQDLYNSHKKRKKSL